MKNPTYKRFLAYAVDIFIVTIIAAMFSEIRIVNPYLDEYENTSNEYLNMLSNQIVNSTIYESNGTNETRLSVTELDKKLETTTYNLSYYGYYVFVITLVVKLLYFIVFALYNDGKTIGKALLKMKVKKNSNRKLRIMDLTIRSVIGYGLLFDLVNIILLRLCDMKNYLYINSIVTYIEFGITAVIVIMILFRKDNRGLHDLLAGTKVIYLKEGDKKDEDRNS